MFFKKKKKLIEKISRQKLMGALNKSFLLLGVFMTGKLMVIEFLFVLKTLTFSIINRRFETSILSSHKALGK